MMGSEHISGKSGRTSASSTLQPGGSPSETRLITQNSLALKVLLEGLRDGKNYSLLDLGPPVRSNFEFFTRYAYRIAIGDVYDGLTSSASFALSDASAVDVSANVFKQILPFQSSLRFDVIFTWDLFHYLSREQLQQLVLHLGNFCHKGTLLFSLISNQQHVSDLPLDYRLLDHENLSYPSVLNPGRPNLRYKEPNLARLLPGFKPHKTFLLRNGMQEHLFSFESQGTTRRHQ